MKHCKIRYIVDSTKHFQRRYKRLIRGQKTMERKIKDTLFLLSVDPFYKSLRTHKVNTRNYEEAFSSGVTSDVRIIWNFDKQRKAVILALSIGGHSGKNRVYRCF